MTPLKVLLVDDDRNILRTLKLSLKDRDCDVVEAGSVPDAMAQLAKHKFDLILTDFRMEHGTGLDLIQQAKRQAPEILIVVMTAFASIENAVSVMKEGAFDYLPKPFTSDQLAHLLNKVRLVVGLRAENQELRRSKSRRDYFAGLTSPASRRLEEFIRKVAPTDATVLLIGESGTGKSELAKLAHDWSPRASRRFITVQCTSLAESLIESELFGHVKGAFTGATQEKRGKLEYADGGTLFLDEIGDLPLSGQAKLLRFLQERVFERVGGAEEIAVDTRIIAATNKNLEEAVRDGSFRDDLYYRLNILECTLVPLRFRREDVPVLLQRLLRELAPPGQEPIPLPKEIQDVLLAYAWPGNIRELRNALERLLMLSAGREVQFDDLPEAVRGRAASADAIPKGPTSGSLEDVEREHIRRVLEQESNQERAAEILGITKVTLWRKRKQYGLS